MPGGVLSGNGCRVWRPGFRLWAVELSVLGLARAKVWLERVPGTLRKRTLLVGVHPHGARGKGVVSGVEAEDYLDAPLEACVRYDRHLHDDMLQGLGLRALRGRNPSCHPATDGQRGVADGPRGWGWMTD